MAQKLYTYQEAAALFQVSAWSMWRWLRGRKLVRVTWRTVRIPESEITRLMKLRGVKHAK